MINDLAAGSGYGQYVRKFKVYMDEINFDKSLKQFCFFHVSTYMIQSAKSDARLHNQTDE